MCERPDLLLHEADDQRQSEYEGEQTIDTLLSEERRYPPNPAFAAQANAQADIYDRDFDEFWDTHARERVSWFEPFHTLYEWELPYAKWFLGGKLNLAYNCVDRHVEAGHGDKVAYHWEGEPADDRLAITYADLQRLAKAVVKVLNPDGLTITQFNGAPAGQTVFHLHVHIIPRYEGVRLAGHGHQNKADQAELEALAKQIAAAMG